MLKLLRGAYQKRLVPHNMLNELTQLYHTTIQLVERIDEVESEQLLDLLELRNVVIMELEQQSNLSEAEKEKLRDICGFDPLIARRMNSLKEEASQVLEKIKQTQIQKKVYEQTYDQAYSSESYFFDQKK